MSLLSHLPTNQYVPYKLWKLAAQNAGNYCPHNAGMRNLCAFLLPLHAPLCVLTEQGQTYSQL